MSTSRIVGADDVRRKIRKMQDALSKSSARSELKNMHAAGAKLVESDAVGRTPVRSGALKASIRSSGTQRSGVVRAGFARVPYAGPIHFGWRARNISPQPFLYDAKDARADEVLRLFGDGVRDLVRKYDLD